MVTVKEFAKELLHEDIELIAGDSDNALKGIIEYLSVQELSNKTSRIKENGFIMTTFNAFADIDHIVNHLEWFKNKGVSAVGFHTAVYRTVPKEVIEYCISHVLPLFFIPSEIAYSVLFDRFNQLLNKKDNKKIEEVNKLNEKMMESVFLDKDMDYIVNLIGNYIGNTVVFLDTDFRSIALWKNRTTLSEDVDTLLKNILENQQNVLIEARLYNKIINVDIGDQKITLIPIFSKSKFYGLLLVGNENKSGKLSQEVIKHGITALKLLADKKTAAMDYQKSEDIRVFENIFKEKSKPADASDLYININKIKYLLLAEPMEIENIDKAFQRIDYVLNCDDRNGLVWILDKKIIGIAQNEVDIDILEKLTNEKTIKIGLSSKLISGNIETIYDSYLQSLTALKHSIKKGKNYIIWDEVGIDKIVYFALDNSSIERFDYEVLQPILDHDKQKGTDLYSTLHSYLRNFFNLKETGQELFLHPNTIKYRLNKVTEILNMDVHNPDNYAALLIAFKMHEIKMNPFVD
ncbi:helix-turn-helix domain-containing protein [Virgibacillus ndiopensis]|uniref:helix-turn-helix domain-containing protein n=1 Tax=Virgibacillus ndiopensis TaxID=2004408 RepID=UPI000C082BF7|nr:PucR family transcriptional regulator [Virgibacillus ndiopensis]